MFPWRFYVAAREIEKGELGWNRDKAQWLYNAVINASVKSLCNMTMFPRDETLLSVADVSGSMYNRPLSEMGSVKPAEVARFYGRMLSHGNSNNDYMEFATKVNTNPSRNPFDREITTRPKDLGKGTDADKIIEYIIDKNLFYNSIVIFTDNQFWNESKAGALSQYSVAGSFNKKVDEYRKRINPNMKLYLLALADYNTGAPVKLTDKNFVVSGFTNDTFRIINNIHKSSDVIEEIERMRI
jgi:hypothetical protein